MTRNFIYLSFLVLAITTYATVVYSDENDCPNTADVLVLADDNLITGEDNTRATFTIQLTCRPSADVVIQISSDNTNEGGISHYYNRLLIQHTLPSWNYPIEIIVFGIDDSIDDGNQQYNIIITITSDDPNYSGLNPYTIPLINIDNDDAGITISANEHTFVSETGGSATFSAVLNSKPVADVTVAITSTQPSEAAVTPNTLTFTTQDWHYTQQFTVSGVDDNENDGQQLVFLNVQPIIGDDPLYSKLDPVNFTVTNIDDDRVGDILIETIDILTTTESGGSDTFTIVLTSEPAADVHIPLNTNRSTEGFVEPSSLIFSPKNWDIPQTVSVIGIADSVVDANQSYSIIVGKSESLDPVFSGINPIEVNVVNINIDLFHDNFEGMVEIPVNTLNILMRTSSGNNEMSSNPDLIPFHFDTRQPFTEAILIELRDKKGLLFPAHRVLLELQAPNGSAALYTPIRPGGNIEDAGPFPRTVTFENTDGVILAFVHSTDRPGPIILTAIAIDPVSDQIVHAELTIIVVNDNNKKKVDLPLYQ